MTKVNEEMTRKVADLAQINLTNSEVVEFTQQISTILDFVGQLSEVDLTNVEPLSHPLELNTCMRDDEVDEQPRRRVKILESAPEEVEGGFKVPRIV